MNQKKDLIYLLTLITVIGISLLSLLSLLLNKLYTDRINRITAFELLGQDTATFIFSLTFLLVIIMLDFNSLKIKIICLGSLSYFFYTYAYFSFGGISSYFYLAYIGLTGLTLFLFIFILANMIKKNQFPVPKKQYPCLSISIFLFVSIALMTVIEIRDLVLKTVISRDAINPFAVFYVLDLSIIFPLIIISSILNLKKNKWGILFAGISLIKIFTILPMVIFADIFYWQANNKFIDFTFDLFALAMTIIALVLFLFYIRNIEQKADQDTSHRIG